MAESVRFIGLEGLMSDMQGLISKAPDELNKAVEKTAREWTKDCNAKMPSSYSGASVVDEEGERKTNKASLKRWQIKKSFNSLGMIASVEVTNKAPHFHLVENGHRKFIHGVDTGGFVEGKHYAEKTRAEYESKYPEKMQEAINKALADRGF
jgi:bacteriophage protein of unknown function (DUF646)|nr:MAG TPA: putative tail-component [Caudoviricetes sp.]